MNILVSLCYVSGFRDQRPNGQAPNGQGYDGQAPFAPSRAPEDSFRALSGGITGVPVRQFRGGRKGIYIFF